jgi:hypothetical protein
LVAEAVRTACPRGSDIIDAGAERHRALPFVKTSLSKN